MSPSASHTSMHKHTLLSERFSLVSGGLTENAGLQGIITPSGRVLCELSLQREYPHAVLREITDEEQQRCWPPTAQTGPLGQPLSPPTPWLFFAHSDEANVSARICFEYLQAVVTEIAHHQQTRLLF